MSIDTLFKLSQKQAKIDDFETNRMSCLRNLVFIEYKSGPTHSEWVRLIYLFRN